MRVLTSTYTIPINIELNRYRQYDFFLSLTDDELKTKIKDVISKKDLIWLTVHEYNEAISVIYDIIAAHHLEQFSKDKTSGSLKFELLIIRLFSELMKFKTKVTTKCIKL